MFNKRKGQSTVEYIILVTAVVSVAILFLVSKDSPFQKKVGGSLNAVTDQMNIMADRLKDSTKGDDVLKSSKKPTSTVNPLDQCGPGFHREGETLTCTKN